jgi:hypothetical protein
MRSRLSLLFLFFKQGFDPAQTLRRMMERDALAGCDSVLDVGSGASMDLRWFGVKHCVGIEAYQPDYEKALQNGSHDEMVLGTVCELDKHFKPNQFDACLSVDVIEHVTKEDGLKMMRDMEAIARRKIVIITPNGWLEQHHTEEGDLQVHLSGWEASEMKGYGYRVLGLLGPKFLRGEYHMLKWRPKFFWGLVSMVGHLLWTRWHPSQAASILCVKTKKTG